MAKIRIRAAHTEPVNKNQIHHAKVAGKLKSEFGGQRAAIGDNEESKFTHITEPR